MKTPYFICDVFTQTQFGGNTLAVVTQADHLSDTQMQSIAREFNFPETAFVLPAHRGGDFHVRIFTPNIELPFAGHPNIGTAFVLYQMGASHKANGHFVFEELAGDVPVSFTPQAEYFELASPEALSLGDRFSAIALAQALSLEERDIELNAHPPQVASVGAPFVMVELASNDALSRAKVNTEGLAKLNDKAQAPMLHCYVKNADSTINARMFAPQHGIPEDPATGSANCALAGLLATLDPSADKNFTWHVSQGVEMGRPSQLTIKANKQNGDVTQCKVGGHAVLVSQGTLFI